MRHKDTLVRVLFVCMGNICRSPMAEALFRHHVRQRGLEHHFLVDSAGTGSWHVGEPPHRGTQRVLDRHQVDWTGLEARQVSAAELQGWDMVIVMDDDNYRSLMSLSPKYPERIRRMLDFHPQAPFQGVPDPYATGHFDEVYDLLNTATKALVDYLVKEYAIEDPDA